jgi:hypothetical protein
VIQVQPNEKLFATVSTAFGSFAQTDQPSTTEVKVEQVKPFPDAGATNCQVPKGALPSSVSGNSISVIVYQLKGAVAQDGKLDQSKICVIAIAHGQDAVGLKLWGSLTARHQGKDTYVGSYLCNIRNAPDALPAEQAVYCPVLGDNNVPDTMWVLPADAELYVASTVTFGSLKSAPMPITVQTYGPY